MTGIDPTASMPGGPPPLLPPSGYPPPDPGDDDPPHRPGRGLVLVAIAVVLLLVAGVAGYLLAGGDDDGGESAEGDPIPATSTTEAVDDDPAADGETVGEDTVGEDTVGDAYTPDSGATGFDVEHYDLAVAWDPEAQDLDGTATITATALQDLTRFSLDLLALDVGSVTVDGDEAEVDVDGRDVRITPPDDIAEGDEFEVVVEYGGTPEPVLSAGFETGWLTTDDGGAYVIGEPDGAATWFPSNDHPSDKATVDLQVTVPRGWTVAGPGAFGGRERGDDGVTWSWSEDDPMATYLVPLAIGRYEVVEDETDDGLPLVSFFPEADADRFESAFADAGEMIDTFAELFGPYPFDEYGAIVVPEPTGLALETQTRSTFGNDVADIELFRAHELAHQWFGDAVTPERWEDIWLNEGFASYAEMLWFEASRPDYDIDADAEARRDTISDGGAIVDPGVDRWFGDAVYQRGGLALHALRRTVGDDAFFEILQRWTAENDGANATTDDFIALAEDVSGEDLGPFFEDWLEGEGVPELP
jgi:aminopeptidase N